MLYPSLFAPHLFCTTALCVSVDKTRFNGSIVVPFGHLVSDLMVTAILRPYTNIHPDLAGQIPWGFVFDSSLGLVNRDLWLISINQPICALNPHLVSLKLSQKSCLFYLGWGSRDPLAMCMQICSPEDKNPSESPLG